MKALNFSLGVKLAWKELSHFGDRIILSLQWEK